MTNKPQTTKEKLQEMKNHLMAGGAADAATVATIVYLLNILIEAENANN